VGGVRTVLSVMLLHVEHPDNDPKERALLYREPYHEAADPFYYNQVNIIE
jgi:hypothetical protein